MSQSPAITVYTTNACPYCVRAKALLEARGIAYEEVNLGRDPETRLELSQRTGMMTFPQILVGDTVVGGFDELAAADRSGRLSEIIAA
ncbi:glutaredoxin [Patulibacter medicamentivorans]|jgi:glutaredoxin 3|uniref:Glutaredoxin n=1 Tax=Patulibacter medicamentivorans TaxID=1097667 RepID=H0E3R5_9ACTN|nr:glutaredoxin 3 [Patulibacter medicamentivorans]EHN11685.1 glutaredoxin [Patulibacter medicamentivorans]